MIFVLVMGINIYTLTQLHQLTNLTDSVLKSDERLLEHENQLRESFLSQLRYEKRYEITRDPAFQRQFLSFKREFLALLDDAAVLTDTATRPMLDSLQEHYRNYSDAVAGQITPGKAGRLRSPKGPHARKEAASEKILATLDAVKTYGQRSIREKTGRLSQVATSAQHVTGFVAVFCLAFIVGISFLITRGIIRPLSIVKKKTEEIGKGQFDGELTLTSPPEISELAAAINMMCLKLQEVDKMKADFFTLMAHELRTPLASIKEGINLLYEGAGGSVSEKQKRILAILREEGLRLINLVNSLLDLSKMDAGMATYTFQREEVPPLLRRVLTEILPLAEAKQITLEEDIQLKEANLKVDSERILQVLRNLVGNAVKFTPEGGKVTLGARHVDRGIEVSVSDTGPGIPEESIAAIFDKYRQAPINGNSRMAGTGLGLAIAKHVISAHGGEIWVESKPQCGSTFAFVLPFS